MDAKHHIHLTMDAKHHIHYTMDADPPVFLQRDPGKRGIDQIITGY